MKSIISVAIISCVALTSCYTTSSKLYSWHSYEDAAYNYQKKATDEAQMKLIEEYSRMAGGQKESRGVVPPGFNAEYGYLLFKTGKTEEGIKMMKDEIKLYPESETYVSRIIKQIEK